METNSCLKNLCCICEEFKATKNKFDNTFVCTCFLKGKGIVVPDVTLITPDLMKSAEIFPGYFNKEEK